MKFFVNLSKKLPLSEKQHTREPFLILFCTINSSPLLVKDAMSDVWPI